MLEMKMRFAQILDSWRSDGWRSLLRQAAYFRRTAIIVEKDLSQVVERPEPFAGSQLKILELDREMLTSGTYRFAVLHRHLKALHHLEQGWRAFVLARNDVIVGDLWYYPSEATVDKCALHEDLRRFGFQEWQPDYVYTFDIFVAPAERKHGLSAAFQNNAMLALAGKRFTKAYAFYFADNIQAVWCTRVTNKWKEVRAVSMSRLLTITWAVPLQKDHAGNRLLPVKKRKTNHIGKAEKRVYYGRSVNKSPEGV